MSEFKVGDKMWGVYVGAGGRDHDFYDVTQELTLEEYRPDDDCPFRLQGDDEGGWYERSLVRKTKREALAEAIRQNEGLASALTMEIARLKEELVGCKD